MREGYGMTETSCVISAMDDGDNLSGHVGSPNPACGKQCVILKTVYISESKLLYPNCMTGFCVLKMFFLS